MDMDDTQLAVILQGKDRQIADLKRQLEQSQSRVTELEELTTRYYRACPCGGLVSGNESHPCDKCV